MTTQTFQRGNFVFKAGEPGETFYIVSNGTFRIFNGAQSLFSAIVELSSSIFGKCQDV
jgi:CRP-like cAMP-binding protein